MSVAASVLGHPGGSTGGDRRLRAEDEFVWFFRAEFEPVVRSVALVMRDRDGAEDVAQDAFVILLRHWKRVSRYERPDAWVRRVALRLARRKAARDRIFRRQEVETAPAPDAYGLEEALWAAVKRLPYMQRAAVVFRYLEDRPTSEIAELLGCSESTARVHLHRARKRLSTLLGEDAADVS
jgi:RNA polymerase sigma-70 factor, ECF subfamily